MKFNNTLRIAVVSTMISIVASCGLLLGIGSSPLLADTTVQPGPSVLTVQLQTVTQRDGTDYQVLAARLTQNDGSPLSERTVVFFEVSDLFGTRNVPLGSALTTSFGVASLKYQTGLGGTHEILAVFSGDQVALPAQVTTNIEITSPSIVVNAAPTVMDHVTRWVEIGVGIILLSVITLLLSVIFRVFRDVPVNPKAS